MLLWYRSYWSCRTYISKPQRSWIQGNKIESAHTLI